MTDIKLRKEPVNNEVESASKPPSLESQGVGPSQEEIVSSAEGQQLELVRAEIAKTPATIIPKPPIVEKKAGQVNRSGQVPPIKKQPSVSPGDWLNHKYNLKNPDDNINPGIIIEIIGKAAGTRGGNP